HRADDSFARGRTATAPGGLRLRGPLRRNPGGRTLRGGELRGFKRGARRSIGSLGPAAARPDRWLDPVARRGPDAPSRPPGAARRRPRPTRPAAGNYEPRSRDRTDG